jgi:hypothetical protein
LEIFVFGILLGKRDAAKRDAGQNKNFGKAEPIPKCNSKETAPRKSLLSSLI